METKVDDFRARKAATEGSIPHAMVTNGAAFFAGKGRFGPMNLYWDRF